MTTEAFCDPPCLRGCRHFCRCGQVTAIARVLYDNTRIGARLGIGQAQLTRPQIGKLSAELRVSLIDDTRSAISNRLPRRWLRTVFVPSTSISFRAERQDVAYSISEGIRSRYLLAGTSLHADAQGSVNFGADDLIAPPS